jgi:hypothetical protein
VWTSAGVIRICNLNEAIFFGNRGFYWSVILKITHKVYIINIQNACAITLYTETHPKYIKIAYPIEAEF